jgi:hypothetical protein
MNASNLGQLKPLGAKGQAANAAFRLAKTPADAQIARRLYLK